MQHLDRGVRFSGTILLLILLLAGLASAQTSNGTIAGVVSDATGAAITNAKVTATSVNTGEVRTTTTNNVGAYRFESVLPGTYTVSASAEGFSTTTLTNLTVVATVVTSANPTLKVGQASDTVTVEATAQLLQTESGEISHTITTAEISKLPISNLNAYSLATTLPGVVTTTGGPTGFTNGTSFAVNGTRPRSNNFLIEGQDNNDAGIHGQGLQPGNLDAVKEVSVLTNSYAAEFGHGGGSVSNLVYKSGTNSFHGAAWDLHRNSALNGTDHFNLINNIKNPLTGRFKDPFHENIYGFDVGGPIKKDKLFFFVSHQWDWYRASLSSNAVTVPTANGIATLKGLLATSTPAQQAQINYLLTAVGGLRGDPNNVSTRTLALGNGRPDVQVGPTRRTVADAENSAELVTKGDYIVTSKDTLNFRYVRSASIVPFDFFNFPTQLPGFDTDQGGSSHNAGVTYTRTFSNTIVNELRASYGRIGFGFNLRPETVANPLPLTSVAISGITTIGVPTNMPQARFHNTYQLQDALSWTRGTHSLKLGFDIADVRVVDTIPFNQFGSIGYGNSTCSAARCGSVISFTGLANFIDNFGATSTATDTFGNPVIHPKLRSQAFYFEDTWKVRSNFTLTYGARYEYDGKPANSLAFPAIDPRDFSAAHFLNRVEQQGDANNFGPRVGIAYTPRIWQRIFGQDRTVIRAGAGFFYDGIFTNILDNGAGTSPNAITPAVVSAVTAANPRGNPNWSATLGALSPVASPFASANPIVSNLINPETYQWNLNIERSLPGSFVFTVGYVGTRGAHQYANTEANPFIIGSCVTTGCKRLFPDRGRITVRDNEADSIYHGLSLNLERRFTHGFLLRGAYTWSKMLDNGSEVFSTGNYSSFPVLQFPTNRGTLDYGPAGYDRRQRLAITYVYQVPNWKTGGFRDNPLFATVSNIVGNWELAGTTTFQSGAPGNVQAGFDWNQDGITNDRPFLGNPNAPLLSWAVKDSTSPTGFCEGNTWWNVSSAEFCSPIDPKSVHWLMGDFGTSTGNFGRNSFRLPGIQIINFAMTKSVKVSERHTVQFRGEIYNPFNHANTGSPNLTLVTGIAGTWTGSTTQTCANHPGLANCGQVNLNKATFDKTILTANGNREIRMMVKYTF